MELKTKYQYTYFIKPFLIKEDKYDKYLFKLLENKNCNLKIFEKEKDLNLYSYFLQNIRENFFPTFNYDKEKIKKLNELDNELKSSILAKLHCNIFEYNIDKEIQGKIDEANGIFFNINKIEIVCFDTGVCFLIIKTHIENSDEFADVLDFNYKFKDINSDFAKLKEFNNIKIQTDKFENMKGLSNFIQEIIGENKHFGLKGIDIYNQRFFVYTYNCIDQKDWNEDSDFDNLKEDFLKMTNVLSHNSNQHCKETIQNIEDISKWKYAKFGFTKQSASLMVSNIDINNYTKLPFKYEHEYLYTLILSLHQRIYIKKINAEFKGKKDINIIRKNFTKFTKEIWTKEITNSETGSMLYSKWMETFELENNYDEIKTKYDVIYKDLGIKENTKTNKIITLILIISLILNVINLIALIKLRG